MLFCVVFSSRNLRCLRSIFRAGEEVVDRVFDVVIEEDGYRLLTRGDGIGDAVFKTYTPSVLVKLEESDRVVGNRFLWRISFPGRGNGRGVVEIC